MIEDTGLAWGNGLRDIEESGRDYARFHGRDEECYPGPLQDVGCVIAKRGDLRDIKSRKTPIDPVPRDNDN